MQQIYEQVRVQALEVQTFRKHAQVLLELPAVGLAFVGPNASGKTSFLEALHKVALLRGFGREEDMVQWGAVGYRIRARLTEGIVEVRYQKGQGTQVLWEGQVVQPLAQWIGRLPVVLLRPGDTEWIEGAAALRRRWADRLLSQADPAYLEALLRYEKALAQRNALLAQPDPPSAQLEAWSHHLCTAGIYLQKARLQLVQALAEPLQSFYSAIGPEKLRLTYKLTTPPEPSTWRASWSRLRKLELMRGRTLLGPHLEDFRLELEGHLARTHASEGQKKSLLIALKWAEMSYLSRLHPHGPLLLLDDLGEKLDAHRLAAVGRLSRTANQTFVTDTDERRLREAFPELPVHRLM